MTFQIIFTIGNIFCTCTPTQRADRKICSHIVWTYLNLIKVEETNKLLAQIYLSDQGYKHVAEKCPDEIPQNLKSCVVNSARIYHVQLKSHSLFDAAQTWNLERKANSRSATCGGCLTKACIKEGDLHLSVEGLLFLSDQNRVVVTTIRFCLNSDCVTNIKSKFNNIRELNELKVHCSFKESLSGDEIEKLDEKGFSLY